ncbi:uncharacterized protein LOC125957905 [Anopheles darlingi]|uniref:uncharacterized protein LOC125957905 n=1 Tax=Anopheles darlingi TaxID=43151 RepID=UPI002100484B|nr:uncharacterized protein LOC125957905 [Anopheles darlingi]
MSLECCWWAAVVLSVASIVHPASSVAVDDNLLYYEREQNDGGYRFEYHTKDGQFRTEMGVIYPGTGTLQISGRYAYSDDKGNTHSYRYVADEKGYRLLPNEIKRTGDSNYKVKSISVDYPASSSLPSYDSDIGRSPEEYDGPRRKKWKPYHSLLGGNKRVETSI